MKRRPCLIACVLPMVLAAAGCSNLAQEAQHSDGLLDFVWAVAGHPRKDLYRVVRVSGRAGIILTAHAEELRPGEIYVSGVLKNGFGYDDIEDAHIDVKVFSPGGRLIAALATDYSPRPIPREYRGSIGRAAFSTRLPFVPPAGSTIQVVFHQCALNECELSRRPLIVPPP